MLNSFQPFNIDLLLLLGKEKVKNLRQISVLDITVGLTKNFHPDGLYSTEIFGKVGDIRRSRNFAYIDLNIPIFHPVYYKALLDLKELYGMIISGKEYAIFDQVKKDFIKSDPLNGETGYKFFLDHFNSLKFEERDSAKRSFNIKLIEKYKTNPLMDKLVVLPAGMRDYTIDETGKPSEDEINNLYRKVIGTSLVIENINVSSNEEYLNTLRYNLQLSVNAIYDYIKNIIEGKAKLIQGKWIARNIDHSTRNVFTPYIQNITDRNHPQFVSATQTVVGLYQFLRSIFPKAVQLVKDTYISKVFPGPNIPAILIDPKTFNSVRVPLNPSYYDDWTTSNGLEKIFYQFKVKDNRHSPIKIGDYYLGLMYNGPDGTYKFVQGVDELPEGIKKEYLHPITYVELLYLSIFQASKEIPVTVTRYPITGLGSIYPSYVYLKSTVTGLVKHELDDDWNKTGIIAPEYPKMDDFFFDALSPASQHLGRLGADYDGDTGSLIAFILEDSKEELNELLNSKKYYLAPNGKLAFSSSNDVIDLVLGNIS